jgi:hypothetical protein
MKPTSSIHSEITAQRHPRHGDLKQGKRTVHEQQLEWLDGGTLAILLDGKATNGAVDDRTLRCQREWSAALPQAHAGGRGIHADQGTALVWCDDQEMELSVSGIVFLPKNIPHAYRIASKKADLLMINTPAGIEGMFRYAGRDRAALRPDGFEIPAERLAEASGAIRKYHPRSAGLTPSTTRAEVPKCGRAAAISRSATKLNCSRPKAVCCRTTAAHCA